MLAKKIVLVIGLAIVFPMMVHFGVSIFSPKPKWKDYRIEDYHMKYKKASPEGKKKLQAEQKLLRKKKGKATKRFQTHLFYVAVPLGIIAIIIGAFFLTEALGAGLMLGGISSATNGYLNSWSVLDDRLRFLSALCVFIILIIAACIKIEKRNPKQST